MHRKNALVLVIDRLGAAYLGPYGNTWIDTPNWNRLAAESFLFDFALADSPRLAARLPFVLAGVACAVRNRRRRRPRQPAAAGRTPHHAADGRSVRARIRRRRQLSRNGSSCPSRRRPPRLPRSNRLSSPKSSRRRSRPSSNREHRPSRGSMLKACRVLGMPRWNFAISLRKKRIPCPRRFVVPPQKRLVKPYDPDELLGVTHAYAGQVALLDLCLEPCSMPWGRATTRTGRC